MNADAKLLELLSELDAAKDDVMTAAELWHEALIDDPVDAFDRGRDLFDAIQLYVEARDRVKAAQQQREVRR